MYSVRGNEVTAGLHDIMKTFTVVFAGGPVFFPCPLLSTALMFKVDTHTAFCFNHSKCITLAKTQEEIFGMVPSLHEGVERKSLIQTGASSALPLSMP